MNEENKNNSTMIPDFEKFLKEVFVVDDCEAGKLKTNLEDEGYYRMDFKLTCKRRGVFFISMYALIDNEENEVEK